MVTLNLNTQLPVRTKNSITPAMRAISNLSFAANKIIDGSHVNDPNHTPDQSNAVNNPVFYSALFDIIVESEGLQNKSYLDTAGLRTIGIGFNMDQWGKSPQDLQQNLRPILEAIGVQNWQAVYSGQEAISNEQAKQLFSITMTGRMPSGGKVVLANGIGESVGRKLQTKLSQPPLKGTELYSGNQLASLTSLVFNNANLVGQNLRSYMAAGDMTAAINEIIRESNATGVGSTLRYGVHGLANRRLTEAAVFAGDLETKLPDEEVWEIVGWARNCIANGRDPNSGAKIPSSNALELRFRGEFPDFFDVPLSPPQGRTTPNTAAGEDWNIVYALRQGDVRTSLHRVDDDGRILQTARLATQAGEIIMGTEGDDILIGGEGNNTILGGPDWGSLERNVGNDILIGGQGEENNLFGGSGNNIIVGGYGANFLYAGGGTNKLTGGGGKPNMFHVARPDHVAPTPFTSTTITDFRPGVDYLTMEHIYGMEELSIQDDPTNNKTVIKYRDNHTLNIEGVRAHQLSRRDFNLTAIDPKPDWPPASLKADKMAASRKWTEKMALKEQTAVQR